jgi:hypothetical protein
MARMEEVFTFPSCFFFRVVAPLYLEELDCFAPRDTILLIQDLDRVLGVGQVSLERCHFWQHDVHICLQTLLQLRHVEDVVNFGQGWWQVKLVSHSSTLLEDGERSDVARC